MKIRVGKDEYWPFMVEDEEGIYGEEIEIPEDLLARWRSARSEWDRVNDRILDLFTEAERAETARRAAARSSPPPRLPGPFVRTTAGTLVQA